MKTKKTLLNFFSDIIPLAIISILGIFKLKIFIQVLGDETLGLYQLFTQIMLYVALVDGGLSSAVLYSLYKPNSENDKQGLSRLLSAALKAFSLIGIIVFLLAAIVAFIVPFFIKDSTFPYSYVVITFLLFSLSNVVGYFFVPYQALLEVKEKKYITNLCLQIGQIIQSALEIILLLCGWSFFSVLIMHSVVKLISNILTAIICKKIYKDVEFNNKEKNFGFLKQVKDLIFHKINGLVGSNIDVLIISKFLGLASVAIYSTYNYIINMLKTIFGKISASILAIVGNSIAESKENSHKLFLELNTLLFFIATIICIPLFCVLNSFINIWYEGEIKTSFFIAFAFVIYLFVFIIKLSITTFVTAGGLFKETKICAITDTITNLILSFVLVWKLGIAGVVIATTISVFVTEFCMKNYVIHKYIFEKNFAQFYIKNIKFFIVAILDLSLSILMFKYIPINTILIWFIVSISFTLVNFVLVLGIYKILGETKFLDRFRFLLRRG